MAFPDAGAPTRGHPSKLTAAEETFGDLAPVLDTWNQTAGDWTDSADWSDQVPTANSAVQIEGGAVTISVSDGIVEANSVDIFTIPQVSLSTPVLTTDGSLTTGALLLTEGTIDGAGTIDASLFMQGGDTAAEDQPTYNSTIAGSLAVTTGSLTVGGGKDGGFDIGGGGTLTATGSSSVHQGFIDGAGTLQNGVYGDTGAIMAFFNSATADTVTNGFSPFNDVTTLGSFINWGTANFDGTPSQFLNDGLVAASIANNGFIQLGVYGGAVATLDGDISGASFANNGQIEVLSGTASIGIESATSLTGAGGALITQNARLIIQLAPGAGSAGVGNGQIFSFSADATLQLDGSASVVGAVFQGELGVFGIGDTIDLANVALSSITGIGPSADNSAYVVTTTAGTIDFAVFGGITTTDILLAQPDGGLGTNLVFAAGGVDTFTNGEGDGQWTTPGNWSISYGGGVPSLTDVAIVQGDTVTVGPGALAQAGTLQLSNGAELIDQGSLFLQTALDIAAGNQVLLSGGALDFASSSFGVTVDSGGRLTGQGDLTAPVVDNGIIEASNGKMLELDNGFAGGFIGGDGTLQIDAGATLEATAGASLTVAFDPAGAGASGQLRYAYQAVGFRGPTLSQMQYGDSILIGGFAQGALGAVVNGGSLTVTSGSQTAIFKLLDVNAGLEFVVSQTSDGGVLVTATDNIPPVITAPAVQIVGTDATTPIAMVSISDADPAYTQITATLTLAGAGSLSMNEAATGGGMVSGALLTITGSQAQIDADLATLAYATTATTAQAVSVTVTAQNNGPDDGNGTNQATPQSIVLAAVPADSSGFIAIASGDWNTGITWSGDVSPGVANDAIDEGAFDVFVSDAESAQSLTIASAASEVDVYGTLSLADGLSVIDLVAGGLGLFGGAIDFQGGTLAFAGGTLEPQSYGNLNNLTVAGLLDVTGNITIGGSFNIVPSAAGGQPQINVSVAELGQPASLYFSEFNGLDVPITLDGQSNYLATLGGADLQLTDTTVTINNGAIDGAAVTTGFGTTITSTGTSYEQANTFVNGAYCSIIVGGGLFSVTGSFLNDGIVQIDTGGTLFLKSTIAATIGQVVGNDGSVTEIAASADSSGTFLYNDPATLILDDAATFGAAIGGFGAGDILDLTGEVATGGSISGTVLTVSLADGGTQTLNVVAGQDGVTFSVTADGGLEVNCFLVGTRIATPTGEVRVERLRIGDMIRTPEGPMAIRWIGTRRIDARRHPRPHAVRPICISANAFAPGQPCRDLYLSPDHAILFEDVLIPVKYLRNDVTVCATAIDDIDYYHIELDRHAVVIAEGLLVETYLETGSRGAFSNHDGVVDLHVAFELRRDHHYIMWEAFGYAQLAVTGEPVERARARLAEYAACMPSVLARPALARAR